MHISNTVSLLSYNWLRVAYVSVMASSLVLAHINVRSLLANFDEFKQLLLLKRYDIIGVSETWLSNGVGGGDVGVPGYRLIRRDRGGRGGGVALYVADVLGAVRIREVSGEIEQVWAMITVSAKKYAFGCIYRPPSGALDEFLDVFSMALCYVQGITDVAYCVGDGNVDFLNNDNVAARRFKELLSDMGLVQLIECPTRVTGNSSTLIDFIVTDDPDTAVQSGTLLVNIADHDLVYCTLPCTKAYRQPRLKRYRNYKSIDVVALAAELNLLPFHYIYYMEDIDRKVDFLNELLIGVLEYHAPVRVSRFTKPYAPWLTDTLKHMMSLRDAALSRFRRTRLSQHWEYYKSLRNLTTNAVRSEKRAFLGTVAATGDSRRIWRTLRGMNVVGGEKNKDIPDDLKDTDKINGFFASNVSGTFCDPDLVNFYTNNIESPRIDKFMFTYVEPSQVAAVIEKIKSNAVGSDGLSIHYIKMCCPIILPVVTHIINSCFERSIYPSAWKSALVTAIPKVNKPTKLEELRPISILPALSKIMEKCMEMQIRVYINDNGILPAVQSGFRPSYSCSTSLLKVTDDIIGARDNSMTTALVMLDYSKAFDRVNHEMLIAVLQYLSFSADAVSLIRSFLVDRRQSVRIDDDVSSPLPVRSGVPQGSVLAPLLFSLYTSQLPKYVTHSSIHMYADDTQVYLSFNNRDTRAACERLSEDLGRLFEYSAGMALTLNASKSQLLLFGLTDPDDVRITINGQMLRASACAKNLGLVLDLKLGFEEHIGTCVRKSFAALKRIYPHRYCLDRSVRRSLCESLVLSQFNYCDEVYGPCLTKAASRRVQRVQNSCLRFINGIRKYERISHTLGTTGWLDMANRRRYHLMCLVRRVILTETPPYLFEKIQFRTDVHHLNLRHRNNVTIPAHSTAIFKRSFSYNAAVLYNAYPPDLRGLTCSTTLFKVRLRKHMQLSQDMYYGSLRG